jgi:hypothetical protein
MMGTSLHDLPISILSALKVINANQHEIAVNSPTIQDLLKTGIRNNTKPGK